MTHYSHSIALNVFSFQFTKNKWCEHRFRSYYSLQSSHRSSHKWLNGASS